MTTLTCFKVYDLRGRLGEELNEEIAELEEMIRSSEIEIEK